MRDVHSARLATGLTLPYVEQGTATGVPVVLLHAYADSWRSFERVLAHLPESLRAFAVSQRGHGDADRPATGYRVDDFAADLGDFMDAVGLPAAVLVASSSASLTAQRFAADSPERTLGLVLIGAPLSLRGNAAVEGFLAEVSGLRDPVDPGFVLEFVESTASESVPPEFLEAMIAESRKLPARVWREALAGLADAQPAAVTATITAPTLILWGDQDAFLSRSDQEALAAAIPGSRLVAYEGAGHLVHWEDPARVAADIATLARRAGRAAPAQPSPVTSARGSSPPGRSSRS